MLKHIGMIVLALFMSGCAITAIKEKIGHKVLSITEKDLRVGLALAEANKDVLPADDQWGACYLKVADTIARVQGTETPDGGLLFTSAMRLHILQALKDGLEDEIKAACGQVFFDVMVRAAQSIPGVQ